MQLRCPNCQHAVEVEGSGAFESIECSSCGSALDLLAEPTSAETTRRSIGHFELLDPIGAGSFGVVWKARDTELDRLVAIKIPRIGLHDLDFAEQFLREARAAAQLRHPHIVAVHEVGRENGTLYIVSEFVQGVTLAERLAASPFPPREAAELLVHIAEALHHAHEAGVIHRDLKPQNIMLDGDRHPKLMDFGLAKREAGEITMTIEGRMLGTPAYMSPEQARGEGHRVDRRTDVYALGVVLFELLTGERPFRGNVQTIVNQVINDEPPSPRKLNSRIPLDLETICLKCMEKATSRRYDSAQVVATELRLFLEGKPIQARPIRQVTRFWRLCRRNPITSSAVGAMVLTGLIAFVVVSVALVHSHRSLRREAKALAQSEQSLQEAIEAVNDLFTTVSENTLLNQPGMQSVREDLLEKALAYYQRFLKERSNDSAVQGELAAAYYRVGMISESLKSPEDALAAYQAARQVQERRLAHRPNDQEQLKALGNTLNALGKVLLKKQDYDSAVAAFNDAVQHRRKLVAITPSNSEYQRLLASTLMNIGSVDLRTAQTSADHTSVKAGLARVRARYEEAQVIRLAALKRDPDNIPLRRDLGKAYYNLGNVDSTDEDFESATKHFELAVSQFEKLIDGPTSDLEDRKLFAVSCRRIGDLLLNSEKRENARPWYKKALDQLGPLAQQNPDVIEYQADLAGLHINRFLLESATGNHSAAQSAIQQARSILEALVKSFPTVAAYQRDLGVALRELAREQRAAGDHQSADSNVNEAFRIFMQMVQQYPQDSDYAEQLEETKSIMPATVAFRTGDRLSRESRWEPAIIEFSTAIRLQPDYYLALKGRAFAHSMLGNRNSAIADYREVLLLRPSDVPSHINLANNLRRKGDLDAALAEYKVAIGLDAKSAEAHYGLGLTFAVKGAWPDAIAAHQEAIHLKPDHYNAQHGLGLALAKQENFDEAIFAFQESIRLKSDFATGCNSLAWLLLTCPDVKLRDPLRAAELSQRATTLAPTVSTYWNTFGTALYYVGDWQKAIVALEKSEELNPKGTSFAYNAMLLAMSHWQLGSKEQAHKWHSQATEWIDKNKAELQGDRLSELGHFEAEFWQLLEIES